MNARFEKSRAFSISAMKRYRVYLLRNAEDRRCIGLSEDVRKRLNG